MLSKDAKALRINPKYYKWPLWPNHSSQDYGDGKQSKWMEAALLNDFVD